jgi:hypothetical protein
MSYKSTSPLPGPVSPDAFVSIDAFGTCQLKASGSLAIEGLKGDGLGNSWRTLIQHKPSDTVLWFDLGVANVSPDNFSF